MENKVNFFNLKKVTEEELQKYFPPPLKKMVMEYFLHTVALIYRWYSKDNWQRSSVVCYKAMDLVEWENMARHFSKGYEQYNIYFSFDWRQYTLPREIIKDTQIFNDPRLLSALEILSPNYLGNDIDVFDKLVSIMEPIDTNDDDDYDDDDYVKDDKEIWKICPIQNHMRWIE